MSSLYHIGTNTFALTASRNAARRLIAHRPSNEAASWQHRAWRLSTCQGFQRRQCETPVANSIGVEIATIGLGDGPSGLFEFG
jgi:hypothetical protein